VTFGPRCDLCKLVQVEPLSVNLEAFFVIRIVGPCELIWRPGDGCCLQVGGAAGGRGLQGLGSSLMNRPNWPPTL